jgi:hypothetical protein
MGWVSNFIDGSKKCTGRYHTTIDVASNSVRRNESHPTQIQFFQDGREAILDLDGRDGEMQVVSAINGLLDPDTMRASSPVPWSSVEPKSLLDLPPENVMRMRRPRTAFLAYKQLDEKTGAVMVWSMVPDKWGHYGRPSHAFGSITSLKPEEQGLCIALYHADYSQQKVRQLQTAIQRFTAEHPGRAGLPKAYHTWLKGQG